MSTAIDLDERELPPKLRYPLAKEPETGDGSAVEVAPGVLWLRMPLFASLPWINIWAIAGERGWTIVDTGLRSSKTIDAWQAAFAGALGGAAIVRVMVTHATKCFIYRTFIAADGSA